MAKPITLEKALELVYFRKIEGEYRVFHVNGDVNGNVLGDVNGNIGGNVYGNVYSVCGNVEQSVTGTINNRRWQFVETPKEKLRRLIEEGADKKQLINALDQLENS